VATPDGKVVANVGAGFVTEEDFADAASTTISPGEELTAEQRAEILDDLVDNEILFQKAIEKGMYRDEKVRKILVNLLVREEVYAQMKDTDIPDEELRAYYEAHREEFVVPEKVQFRRIFVRTGDDRSEEAAQSLVQSLHGKLQADPSRFEALAHEYSDDPNKRRGGDVGYVGRDGRLGLPQEVVDKAFTLATGQLSEPFEAGGGLNLIQVTARRDAMDRTYEQMKGSVLRKLKNERVEERTKAYVAAIRKDIDVEIDEAALAAVEVEARPVPPGGLDPSVLSGMPGRPSMGAPGLGPTDRAAGMPAGEPTEIPPAAAGDGEAALEGNE
jgi:parvulin-like peptidyl-prolyl isomerase